MELKNIQLENNRWYVCLKNIYDPESTQILFKEGEIFKVKNSSSIKIVTNDEAFDVNKYFRFATVDEIPPGETIHNSYYKVEGNIIYPNMNMLTWGPVYYHSLERAKARMESILIDITAWCNLKDPSLNIEPQNVVKAGDTQIVFDIQAWKDSKHLKKCGGIISIENIYFEDE